MKITVDVVNDVVDRCSVLHSLIAEEVFPNAGEVRCLECGHSIDVDTADCARYLKEGWPKHCNRTMRLIMGGETEIGD